MDNLHENVTNHDSPHLLLQPEPLETFDTLDRLIRTSNRYKTKLQHALNMKDTEFRPATLIMNVDYTQAWSDRGSAFDVENTFSWLDWIIAQETLSGKNKTFQLEKVDQEQQVQLFFNIFPKGRGILHKLATMDTDGDEEGGSSGGGQAVFTKAFKVTKLLFDVAATPQDHLVFGAESGCTVEIPILPDLYGATPVELALGFKS